MVLDNEVKIIKVTVPSDKYLEQRKREKFMEYKKLLQADELRQVQFDRGEVIPIEIGALGSINNDTNQ